MGIGDGTVLCTDLKILGSEALFFFFFLAQNKTIVGHRLQSLWELGWYYFVVYCLSGKSSTQWSYSNRLEQS